MKSHDRTVKDSQKLQAARFKIKDEIRRDHLFVRSIRLLRTFTHGLNMFIR